MYSTCIFCHANLGSNEAIEHFPVGRRLAFDAQRGRLWVVCRRCERWNLTPVEDRWEAIEECERLFRDTRLRVSTDNIGLARIREGLELVRIGAPQRPEMAAWRYGDQFGRRRRKHLIYSGGGLAIASAFVVLGPVTGVIAGSSWGLWNLVSVGNSMYQQRRVRARILLPGRDAPVAIRLRELGRIAVIPADEGWALRIPFEVSGESYQLTNGRMLQASRWNARVENTAIVSGPEALHAAARLLPSINAAGAKRDEVQSAVGIIEEAPDPNVLFARYAKLDAEAGGSPKSAGSNAAGRRSNSLLNLPKEVRLALEMATHEASERRALEGELALLEAAWQQAEEIAAIADDMFVTDETREKLAALRRSGPTGR